MKWLKIFGVSGMIVHLIAFTSIMLAIAYSPSFSWTENALSDLGVQEGVTAVLFNADLIISGILGILFATGLFTFLQGNLLSRIGAFVLLLDMLALTAIGVFPENVRPLHFYASVAFFALLPMSMFILSAAFLRTSKTRLGFFTFTAAIVAALVWIIPFGKGVAIPENCFRSFTINVVSCFRLQNAQRRLIVRNYARTVQEMILAVWLIVKGFNSSAIAS